VRLLQQLAQALHLNNHLLLFNPNLPHHKLHNHNNLRAQDHPKIHHHNNPKTVELKKNGISTLIMNYLLPLPSATSPRNTQVADPQDPQDLVVHAQVPVALLEDRVGHVLVVHLALLLVAQGDLHLALVAHLQVQANPLALLLLEDLLVALLRVHPQALADLPQDLVVHLQDDLLEDHPQADPPLVRADLHPNPADLLDLLLLAQVPHPVSRLCCSVYSIR
jgi:hypothetical protein